MSVLVSSPAWQVLAQHYKSQEEKSLADIALAEGARLDNCTLALEGLRLNHALQGVSRETLSLLVKLAEQQKLEDWRRRMFAGDKINDTENRSVLHTALRQQDDTPVMVDGKNVIPEIHAALKKMRSISESIRNGEWKGATGKPIKHVVNIGIGGSDLGPRLAVDALRAFADGPETHFVANVDAYDLLSVIAKLDPAETLFVVVSKTFTTLETLMNAQTARKWIVTALGEKAPANHFVAVSTNAQAIAEFGIAADNMLPMWDWVGGRYSVWSPVGLSVAIALGMDNFEKMLQGAAAMDKHFSITPLAQNMPVVLGLLGIWNGNFLGAKVLAVLPYNERLRQLPRFLQQLEMESNGKSVTRDNTPVDYDTTPVLFGEPGTVGQHSFHQWLHQGTHVVPVDFVGVVADDLNQPEHQKALLSNMVAQASAFAFGQTEAGNPRDVYAGNRPSSILMLDRLDAYHFGMLVSLYEHKVFVQGIIWNINSFDQPGVELGKKLAKKLASGTVTEDASSQMAAALYNKIAVPVRK